MIQLDMPQRTPEWLLVRAGIPTASQFSRVITPSTLEPKTAIDTYVSQLLAEMIMGGPIETDTTLFMERGIELEEQALEWYELGSKLPVTTVGFCMTDDMKIGCSPDALVGDDGGCEIKVPGPAKHVEYLMKNELPSAYLLQVQGSMLVTGRKWWDFVSYHPTIPSLVVRVERDEEIIERLTVGLQILHNKLEEGRMRLHDITGLDVGINKTGIIEKYTRKVA